MSKYSIGIDLGTKSIRAVLVDIDNGREISNSVSDYKHGILDSSYFKNEGIKDESAFQDPLDYKESLFECLKKLLLNTDINKKDIVGIGIDSSCSTFFPIDKKFNPLSINSKYKNDKNAYVKMWKHHSASKYADEITEYDLKHNSLINEKYGGKTSSEWFFPKLIETFIESRDVYDDAYSFIEVVDYCI